MLKSSRQIFKTTKKQFFVLKKSFSTSFLTKNKIFSLENIKVDNIIRNASVPELVEYSLKYDKGAAITETGALVALSGEKTGRSPKSKRIVREETTSNDIWWESPFHKEQSELDFSKQKDRALDFLETRERLYVFDGFAGWDKESRLKIRIVMTSAYHALFMKNMLIEPTAEELKNFGKPDFTVYNGGDFSAYRKKAGDSKTCVTLNFKQKEMVILGTRYAGEMKKGVFTVMHYLMPKKNLLSLHASANEGKNEDVSLFFGLSGTGKTTLSCDPLRQLVGDDEHVWTDKGVFNIEGGCYAKCVGLNPENEPEIYGANKFGAVQENVVFHAGTRAVDYDDVSITENTRCSYPLEFIPNAKIPAVAGQAKNVILLTCDAFGVLPPVSKLTPEQAMYHFIAGYTSKVAGTEMGVTEPTPTFSACFGGPFLVFHPAVYAELLSKKLKETGANAWLINTGWTGGKYGVGKRISLKHTRALIDAIHSGELENAEYAKESPIFGLDVPKKVSKVPSEILFPRNSWKNKEDFDKQSNHLASLFNENFKIFESGSSEEIINAGPKVQ